MAPHRSAPPDPPPDTGAHLPEALTSAPLAIGITRGALHIVEWLNPAARSMLGVLTAAPVGADAVGRPLGAVVAELAGGSLVALLDRLVALLDRVYATGEPLRKPAQQIVSHRGGRREERTISLSCQPMHANGAHGGVTGLLMYGVDLTEHYQASRRSKFLADAGPALLEASLEHRDALDRAARLAVSELGDLCVINLLRPDGSLVRAAVVHADPELASIAEQLKPLPPLPDSPNHQVLDSGKPMVIRDLAKTDPWSVARRGQQEVWDRLALTSCVLVPMVARGRTLGTFAVSSSERDRYTDADVALIEGLALRAGLALDTAALYDSQRHARELADRAAARTAGLLQVTAALSGALSPAAIAEVVVSQGTDLLGASSAVLFVRAPEGLELVHATGWSPDSLQRSQTVPLVCGNPVTDAVLEGVPVWLDNHDDALARYPEWAPRHRGGNQAAACLPLIVEGVALGAMNFSFTAAREFGTDDRTFLQALAGQCAQALDRSRLDAAERNARATAEWQRDQAAVLAEASLALDTPASLEQRLQRLTQLVVPRIADWCAVHLVRDSKVEHIAHPRGDPDMISAVEGLVRRYQQRDDAESSGMLRVISAGQPELVNKISHATPAEAAENETHPKLIRALGITSAIIVPLRMRERTAGTITLVAAGSGRHLGSDDLAFAQDLATRTALALDNTRLYQEQYDIAATLQAALLPQDLPDIPGVRLAGRYAVAGDANQVGGDLYDVFASSSPGVGELAGPWSLLIGDVCGKGATAAALTALIRYTVRAEASHRLRPTEVLNCLNDAIIRQRGIIEDRFCTAIYGVLTVTDDVVRVAMACAGHLAPRVLRHNGVIDVGQGGGTLLGVYRGPQLAREDVHLAPGDTLVLVTDGVTEARGPAGFYGEERLDALLAGCLSRGAGSIADTITEDVLTFQAGSPRDDIAVLVVQAVLGWT